MHGYRMTSKIQCQVKKKNSAESFEYMYLYKKQTNKNKQKNFAGHGSSLWGGELEDRSEGNGTSIFIYILLYYLNALFIIIFLFLKCISKNILKPLIQLNRLILQTTFQPLLRPTWAQPLRQREVASGWSWPSDLGEFHGRVSALHGNTGTAVVSSWQSEESKNLGPHFLGAF